MVATAIGAFTALLRADGWWINAKRVQRIWQQEGLKVRRAGRRLGLAILQCGWAAF
jgi:hypothetical protein